MVSYQLSAISYQLAARHRSLRSQEHSEGIRHLAHLRLFCWGKRIGQVAIDIDLAKHPTLLANLYEPSGSTLVLAAHANASAPAHCRRDASLPYTGSHAGLSAGAAGGLLAVGVGLLLITRRRSGSPA